MDLPKTEGSENPMEIVRRNAARVQKMSCDQMELVRRKVALLKKKPEPVVPAKTIRSPTSSTFDQGIPPEPRTFDGSFKSESEILVFSGADHLFEIRRELNLEYVYVPLNNPMLQDSAFTNGDIGNNLTLVYITHFFDDNADFTYYVRGNKNMSKFLGSTYGTKPYDGPCFATPCLVYNAKQILSRSEREGVKTFTFDRVKRDGMNKVRWKYLFESARVAYDKLDIDWDKLRKIRKSFEGHLRENDDYGLSDSGMEVEEVDDEDGKTETDVEKEIESGGKGHVEEGGEDEQRTHKGKGQANVEIREKRAEPRRDSGEKAHQTVEGGDSLDRRGPGFRQRSVSFDADIGGYADRPLRFTSPVISAPGAPKRRGRQGNEENFDPEEVMSGDVELGEDEVVDEEAL